MEHQTINIMIYMTLLWLIVCISGQLYLIQLSEEIYKQASTVKLIQLNTDGIMLSIERKYLYIVRSIIAEWEKCTGFVMEETFISTVVQRDVNNYIMKEPKG